MISCQKRMLTIKDEVADDDDDQDRDDGDDACWSRNRLPPPHETQPIIRRGHRFSKIASRASTRASTSSSTRTIARLCGSPMPPIQ